MKHLDTILPEMPSDWTPHPLPGKPRGYSKDAFVLPEHAKRLLAVLNPHDKDSRIWFDEEPHKYYVDGIETSGSCTGLVHTFFEEFQADLVIANMMKGKKWPRSTYMSDDVTDYLHCYSVIIALLSSVTRLKSCEEKRNALNGLINTQDLSSLINSFKCIIENGISEEHKGTVAMSLQTIRLDIKRNAKHFPNYHIIEETFQRITRTLAMTTDQIKVKWDADGAYAANQGTWMHLQAELFLNRDPCHTDTIEMQTFFTYLERQMIPLKVKAFRTEWEIYSEEENIAGSIDFVGIKPNGHLVLVDWKRTKELEYKMKSVYNTKMKEPMEYLDDCSGTHYKLQLNIYKYMIEKNYNYVVDEMQVACFHPDRNGCPFVVDVPIMKNEVAYMMAYQRKKHADSILERYKTKLMRNK